MSLPKAVVVGVGSEDGLGAALSRCYAAHDHHVLVAGRTLAKVEKVAGAINGERVFRASFSNSERTACSIPRQSRRPIGSYISSIRQPGRRSWTSGRSKSSSEAFRIGTLLIRRLKTDQAGERSTAYAGETVSWLRIWSDNAGITEGVMFRRPVGRGRVGDGLHPDIIW